MSERFVCPDMALYKHCIYSLFVLSYVTDCFTVCCQCGLSMANKDAVQLVSTAPQLVYQIYF